MDYLAVYLRTVVRAGSFWYTCVKKQQSWEINQWCKRNLLNERNKIGFEDQ